MVRLKCRQKIFCHQKSRTFIFQYGKTQIHENLFVHCDLSTFIFQYGKTQINKLNVRLDNLLNLYSNMVRLKLISGGNLHVFSGFIFQYGKTQMDVLSCITCGDSNLYSNMVRLKLTITET